MKSLAFAIIALVYMVVGRQFGWGLSKRFLYTAPIVLSFIGTVVWGIVVGWSMSGLIGWLHPNIVFRWVLGFGLAAYVAVPNYGLFQETTIPEWEQMRHAMISWFPLIAYLVTEFVTKSMRA